MVEGLSHAFHNISLTNPASKKERTGIVGEEGFRFDFREPGSEMRNAFESGRLYTGQDQANMQVKVVLRIACK